MGDAAGQAPERFHALGLTELLAKLLELLAGSVLVGDIDEDTAADEGPRADTFSGGAVNLQLSHRPPSQGDRDLASVAARGVEDFFEVVLKRTMAGRIEGVSEGSVEQELPAFPEELGGEKIKL